MQNLRNLKVCYSYGGHTLCTSWWGNSNITLTDSKFYFFTQGRAQLIIAGKEYIAKAGDLFLIPAGVNHSFHLIDNEPMTQYWFHFSVECQDVSFFSLLNNLPCHIFVGQNKTVYQLFKTIINTSDEVTNLLEVDAAILRLISFYIAQAQISPRISDASTPLSEVLKYIHLHFSEELTLQQLASAAHLHPNYFIRLFKSVTGMTPARYIQKKRISASQGLLEYTNESISEIMQKTGFRDLSHFSKAFKKECGYTPRQYRTLFSNNQR